MFRSSLGFLVFFVALAGTAWAEAPAAVTEEAYPQLVTRATWLMNVGISLNLTEGNSSTRLLGAASTFTREGPKNFVTGVGSGQYGVSRTPSRVPVKDGASPAERAGTPGKWKFDENINNYLAQVKYGHYLSWHQTNYGYGLFRFEGNRFAGFWERYESQAGYGRRFWAGDWLVVKAETGPDFTEDHLVVNRIRSRFALAATVLAAFKLGETSTLNQELTHLRTVASNDPTEERLRDHRSRSTTALLLQVTKQFHLQTSLVLDYASRPAPGAHPLDVKLANAFLYTIP